MKLHSRSEIKQLTEKRYDLNFDKEQIKKINNNITNILTNQIEQTDDIFNRNIILNIELEL
jgi:hypothetical protein